MTRHETSAFRGNAMYLHEDGEWRYTDTDERTSLTWMERPCGHCLLPNRSDEHDACLGELPGVINACCGHSRTSAAYVQFEDKSIERGDNALAHFKNQGVSP